MIQLPNSPVQCNQISCGKRHMFNQLQATRTGDTLNKTLLVSEVISVFLPIVCCSLHLLRIPKIANQSLIYTPFVIPPPHAIYHCRCFCCWCCCCLPSQGEEQVGAGPSDIIFALTQSSLSVHGQPGLLRSSTNDSASGERSNPIWGHYK